MKTHLLSNERIQNTLVYTQLLQSKDYECASKESKNAEEVKQYIEKGFDYVCTTSENLMLFKKWK
jgi:hypothetical protein